MTATIYIFTKWLRKHLVRLIDYDFSDFPVLWHVMLFISTPELSKLIPYDLVGVVPPAGVVEVVPNLNAAHARVSG